MPRPPPTSPLWSGWRPTGSRCVSGPRQPLSSSWRWVPPPAYAPAASGWSSWQPTPAPRSCSWPPSWCPPPSARSWPVSAVPAGTRVTRMTPGPMTPATRAEHPEQVRAPLPPMTRLPSRARGPGVQTPGSEPEGSGPKGAEAGSASSPT